MWCVEAASDALDNIIAIRQIVRSLAVSPWEKGDGSVAEEIASSTSDRLRDHVTVI